MKDEFIIKNGVLEEYTGGEKNVVLPEGLKTIGGWAFAECNSLESVTIPEGVSKIDEYAFYKCSNLRSVIIPESMKSIECGAFSGCPNLSDITILAKGIIFNEGAFDVPLPEGLISRFDYLYPHMTEECLLYILVKNDFLKGLSLDTKADIYLRTNGYFVHVYKEFLSPGEEEMLGRQILDHLDNGSSEDYCRTASRYLIEFSSALSDQLIQDAYDKLSSLQNGVRGRRIIERTSSLAKRLRTIEKWPVTAAEQKVKELLSEKVNNKKIGAMLKKEYSLNIENLPVLFDNNGTITSPMVLAWLLLTGRQESRFISIEEKEVIAMLDRDSFMKALKTLVDDNLPSLSRAMYLAYPICRYADENLLGKLTKTASKWKSGRSGKNAPSLKTFRNAILYNDSRTAMLFADQYGDLGEYAKLRRIKEDALRNKNLSDVGLDTAGRKEYDLGSQTVTVEMQKDFSFIVKVAQSSKPSKTLPKKGSDVSKYEAAKKDFSDLKRNVKKTVKNRCSVLFSEFLSGKDLSASEWKKVYLENPVLRNVASLFVWKQEERTFTLTDSDFIDKNGKSINLSNKRIAIAHPMDMDESDIEAWQDYFAQKGLKQPFAQVWEPVLEAESIKDDRYKDCRIPYYWFRNREKHGIRVEDQDFHNNIIITFDDCDAYAERVFGSRHQVDNDDPFEVQRFRFIKYTRKVNHIVAFLDRITLFERIRKDDIAVAESVKTYTLAQVLECITYANEIGSKNCLAVLLDERNKRWPEYNGVNSLIMDEL